MNFNHIKSSRVAFQVALLSGAMLFSAAGLAASQCKGMQQDACAAAGQCVWVNGYLRKDGRSVASHCKTRSGKKMPDQAAWGKPKLGQAK
jgi:hypothetical protein